MRLPELEELATYRLDQQLSFAELEAAMTEAGFPVPLRTIHGVLKYADKGRLPHETTLHQIKRFLAHEREAGRLPALGATASSPGRTARRPRGRSAAVATAAEHAR